MPMTTLVFWERGSKCIHLPAELFDMGRGKIELLDTLLDQKFIGRLPLGTRQQALLEALNSSSGLEG